MFSIFRLMIFPRLNTSCPLYLLKFTHFYNTVCIIVIVVINVRLKINFLSSLLYCFSVKLAHTISVSISLIRSNIEKLILQHNLTFKKPWAWQFHFQNFFAVGNFAKCVKSSRVYVLWQILGPRWCGKNIFN